jgi:hypothetical protein
MLCLLHSYKSASAFGQSRTPDAAGARTGPGFANAAGTLGGILAEQGRFGSGAIAARVYGAKPALHDQGMRRSI